MKEIPDEKIGVAVTHRSSCPVFLVFWRSQSAQSGRGSQLCTADRPGVQWLSLHAARTESCRTKIQAARLCRSSGRDQGHKDRSGKEAVCPRSSWHPATFGHVGDFIYLHEVSSAG